MALKPALQPYCVAAFQKQAIYTPSDVTDARALEKQKGYLVMEKTLNVLNGTIVIALAFIAAGILGAVPVSL